MNFDLWTYRAFFTSLPSIRRRCITLTSTAFAFTVTVTRKLAIKSRTSIIFASKMMRKCSVQNTGSLLVMLVGNNLMMNAYALKWHIPILCEIKSNMRLLWTDTFFEVFLVLCKLPDTQGLKATSRCGLQCAFVRGRWYLLLGRLGYHPSEA